MKKTIITLTALAFLAVSFSGCASTGGHKKACCEENASCCEEKGDCYKAKETKEEKDCCKEKKDCCEDDHHKADKLGAGCCG
jgi:hypothetical protein